MRDNFILEGNILWDGAGDTLQYAAARPAQLTFIDNDAPAQTEPTHFSVDAGGRPVLRSTRRSAQAGRAETTLAMFDPTLYTLSDAALSQWTGAVFQNLAQLAGLPDADRRQTVPTGLDPQRDTGSTGAMFWARSFGGTHQFQRDGLFTPPARHRFAGRLAGFSKMGEQAGAGVFIGSAEGRIKVSGAARDEDSKSVFMGAWAATRLNQLDLSAAVLFGRSKYRSEWQRANNRVSGGSEHMQTDYSGLFISPELGLATRLDAGGVAVRPALRLRYLGMFTENHAYRAQPAQDPTVLKIKPRGLHIGLARASLGFPFSFAADNNASRLGGELRIGAEGRLRLGGDRVRGTLGALASRQTGARP